MHKKLAQETCTRNLHKASSWQGMVQTCIEYGCILFHARNVCEKKNCTSKHVTPSFPYKSTCTSFFGMSRGRQLQLHQHYKLFHKHRLAKSKERVSAYLAHTMHNESTTWVNINTEQIWTRFTSYAAEKHHNTLHR